MKSARISCLVAGRYVLDHVTRHDRGSYSTLGRPGRVVIGQKSAVKAGVMSVAHWM